MNNQINTVFKSTRRSFKKQFPFAIAAAVMRQNRWSLVLLGCSMFFHPVHAQTRGLLVVVNSGENSVSVINPKNPNQTRRVEMHQHPQDVVVSANGKLAYVAEMGTAQEPGNTIAVIDLGRARIVKRFVLAGATMPHLLQLSPDGRTLFAACAPENAIVELSVANGRVRKLWNTTQKGSYLMAVTPDQAKIYVANFDAGTVSVIHRRDGSVKVIPWDGQPIGIDVSPDGREVWVSNFQNNRILVIDTNTDRIKSVFSSAGDGPARLKFTRDGKFVLVTQARTNELVVFQASTRQAVRHVATGKFSKGLLVLANGRRAFVSAMDDNQVCEADALEGRVTKRVNVGKAPEGLGWSTAVVHRIKTKVAKINRRVLQAKQPEIGTAYHAMRITT